MKIKHLSSAVFALVFFFSAQVFQAAFSQDAIEKSAKIILNSVKLLNK